MANTITIDKISDVEQAIVGQEILYTITVKNTTGVILNSAIVSDLLSPNLAFVDGSLKIDGISVISGNILTGIEIAPMGINSVKTISFKAIIKSKTEEFVSNKSTVVYKYLEDGVEIIETKTSEPVLILVEIADVICKKESDKEIAELNDIISYKVELKNNSTIDIYNVIYKDILPKTVELILDSVKINGVLVNNPDLEKGINIGSMQIGEIIEITYSVRVIGGSCDGEIINKGLVEYFYVLPNSVTGSKTSELCTNTVKVNIVTFKQMMLDRRFTVPCQKPDIEEIDNVSAEIIIDNSYVIDTVKSTSNEAQQLNYHKLIVHGKVKISVEYTALVCDQAMHSAHQEVPFSTFLILPVDYEEQIVDVSCILENVSFEQISTRCIDVGIVFLVIGQIK